MSGTPAAEFRIDEALVRALLQAQHPDLATLRLEPVENGWDNVMVRLGDELAVRLPRRKQSVALLVHEQQCLPGLAARLPLPIPVPVRSGLPGFGYPCPWTIVPWFHGRPANESPPHINQAPIVAQFLRALHQDAPANAPENNYRGGPLNGRAEAVAERLNRLKPVLGEIAPLIERAWCAGLGAPAAEKRSWLHGDLHARNILVEAGRICAIIDWGDITSGDVATDLAGVWALFADAAARQEALDAYGATHAERVRARAWAINFGSILLETGLVDMPRHAAMGLETLQRVANDFARY
jgi:aminoglycoside phosphotransferase (APT) family kinase protein